ncbi:hypothetical protein OROHE_006294 [Orobanche hederae]
MASSQTSSHSLKRDQIIDGRLFSRSTVMDRIRKEVEDDDSVERIIIKLEEQGLYRLGHSHTEMYDEQIVEEFYHDASVKVLSCKHGGGVSNVSATVQGISICIDRELLVTMFGLPSDGLTMEELESFGSDELLTAYWGLFTGSRSNTDVHPPCPKKKFCLPFAYLHDFCCRIIESKNRNELPRYAKDLGGTDLEWVRDVPPHKARISDEHTWDLKQYKLPLTISNVMSGQYEDDLDNCENIIYTGQGGNNLLGNKRQYRGQVLERGNLGLQHNDYCFPPHNCMEQSVPVRVVRGHKCDNSYVRKVYTYDGLYMVVKYWAESVMCKSGVLC